MSRPRDDHGIPQPIDAPGIPSRAYSPGQIAGAAFLGGPLAGSLLLASNFTLFGSRLSRGQTILLGVLATFAVVGLAVVVPENTPNALIPALYAGICQQISQHSHGAEFKEFISSGGKRYSHWRVLGIGVACLVAFLAAFVAVLLVLPEQYLPSDAD